MARAFYLPNFEKQLTGSQCAPYNCTMASTAMAVQQSSLGAIDTNADDLRKLSGTWTNCYDADPTNNGTGVADSVTAAARKGVHMTGLDRYDGKTFNDVVAYLKAGRFAAVHGDYDQIPVALRGDKDFLGNHSTFWHEYRASVSGLYNGTTGAAIRVGDPLNDGRRTGIPNGYVWWPVAVAKNYMEKFPGTGMTLAIIDRKIATVRVDVANVRSGPSTATSVVTKLTRGKQVAWGVVVIGQSVAGDRRWYRVWEPTTAKVAFMHASVVSVSVVSGV